MISSYDAMFFDPFLKRFISVNHYFFTIFITQICWRLCLKTFMGAHLLTQNTIQLEIWQKEVKFSSENRMTIGLAAPNN